MSEKYYAVRVGKKPGIYRSWSDCSLQVTGYKGAEFKKFDSEEEAISFVKKTTPYSDNVEHDALEPDEMVAYVDGSYDESMGLYSFGVVLFVSDGKETYSEAVRDEQLSQHRNVSGELRGALYAIDEALRLGKKRLYLHYDYAGIEKWAKGEWKTNLPMTQDYQCAVKEANKNMDIHFIKVKAHSGDPYNEEADQLAKSAIEEKK